MFHYSLRNFFVLTIRDNNVAIPFNYTKNILLLILLQSEMTAFPHANGNAFSSRALIALLVLRSYLDHTIENQVLDHD